jgi:hypothetical protein
MSKQTWRSPDKRYTVTRKEHDALYWCFFVYDQVLDQTRKFKAAYGYLEPHFDDERITDLLWYQADLEKRQRRLAA